LGKAVPNDIGTAQKMDDLLEEFIAETRETLELLSVQLVQWERTPEDRSLVDSAFRFVHTVKGSCGFLDLPRLLKLSHAAEDLLSSARDGHIAATPDLVTAVLAVIDKIADITNALDSGAPVYDNDEQLITAIMAFLPKDDTGKQGNSLPSQLGTMADNKEIVYETKNRSVRVSLQLLDTLMSGVSDMVLARNEVSRQMRKHETNTELDHAFVKLSSSVAEIRDAIGLMRMQPIERLFSSLPRLMRDICHELGKEINMTISGSEVDVDREMVEALRDPLTHILRNAADHGIENAHDRIASGKPAVGKIAIGARQSGNQILIEVSDGRGINLERLREKAISSGYCDDSAWSQMAMHDRLATIFLPGVSTAESVSAISGRGVGMDIVRTNLQSVGGTIDIDNVPGKGVALTMRLPLTLSIIAGLSVRAGDQIFGVARSSVVEILSISNANVQIENVAGKKIANVRGHRFPYGNIEDILSIPQISSDTSRILIIISPAVGAQFALEVAAVLDNEELVIKPGAPLVMGTGLYSGTSLPDNGRPMLLLDASGLAAEIGADAQSQNAYNNADIANNKATEDDQASAIMFIGMDGEKRAIRLTAIDRLEDIAVSNIKFVGGKLRANIEGELTDIFDLDAVPSTGFVHMLRLSDGEASKYLAVNEVLDVFCMSKDITASAHPNLHEGIVQVDGEPIELLNVFQYFELQTTPSIISERRPLCYIACSPQDHWERNILEPLLAASGYEVSFDAADKLTAQVVIGRDDDQSQMSNDDDRILRLRHESFVSRDKLPSIYRYDRIGLISAIEDKLAGVR
jgi:two-component system, chemotaxis family, sensor kinase CheA